MASSLDTAPHTEETFTAIDNVDCRFVFEAPSQQPTYTIAIACP